MPPIAETVARCGSRDRTEQHAGKNCCHAKTACGITYHTVCYINQSFGDTARSHDASGNHEERESQKCKVSDTGVHSLGYECHGGNRVNQQQTYHGSGQCNTNRHTDQ